MKLLAGDAGLAGAHIGIEADDVHRPQLEALAHRLGLVPLLLPSPMDAQARAAYHAAANLAASGVLVMTIALPDLQRYTITARATVRPPNPESNIPMARFASGDISQGYADIE